MVDPAVVIEDVQGLLDDFMVQGVILDVLAVRLESRDPTACKLVDVLLHDSLWLAGVQLELEDLLGVST